MEHAITLKINGRDIALNPFVRKIIGNVLLGAVQSLDKVPQPWERIEIVLQADDKKESPGGKA